MRNFSELAAAKSKPGTDIVDQMTPEKAHLLHMAIGISGEAGEILAAVRNEDTENLIEEVGDIRFYMAGLQNALGWPDHEAEARPANDMLLSAVDVVLLSADILDTVKKYCIYNKPLDHAGLHIDLESLRGRLARMMACIGVSAEQVFAANLAKLNKRYAGGYTDQEAQERKDKQ